MQAGDTVIGVDAYFTVIMDLVKRLTALIEQENGIIIREGSAQIILRDPKQHAQKMGLYQRFETLARILSHASEKGMISDTDMVRRFLPVLTQFQCAVSVNNELLKVHIEQHERLMLAVMRGIEAVRPPIRELRIGEAVCP